MVVSQAGQQNVVHAAEQQAQARGVLQHVLLFLQWHVQGPTEAVHGDAFPVGQQLVESRVPPKIKGGAHKHRLGQASHAKHTRGTLEAQLEVLGQSLLVLFCKEALACIEIRLHVDKVALSKLAGFVKFFDALDLLIEQQSDIAVLIETKKYRLTVADKTSIYTAKTKLFF